jgi:uroporphyrinogen decarboxylase
MTAPSRLTRYILEAPSRLVMPIGVYAGLPLTGASVRQVVSDAQAQTEAVLALHEHCRLDFLLTAMDLSAEAETFGCTIRMDNAEIPTVIGRLVTDAAGIDALPAPQPGDARTAIHLATVGNLVRAVSGRPILGGMIGPFSLAGRLFGVSELLEAAALEPELVERLLDKVTPFLTAYARAFRAAGAWGVVMAEPAAGLLSPRALARLSTPYVRAIVEAVQDADFTVVLHNCGARLAHLAHILPAGARVFHFGAPMDLPAALEQVGDAAISAGNLDPTAVFYQGMPQTVQEQATRLLDAVGARPNFVLSSGCDLPPGTPVPNVEALFAAARGG